jgi:hypothetical protein
MSEAAAAEVATEAKREGRSRDREALWNLLHLGVLSAFALAQPLYDLLRDNPEFFAARGSTSFEILSFAVLVVLLPPLLLLALELLAGLAHRRARQAVHLVFVALLVALIAVQALKKAVDASDAVLILVSAAVGAGLAAAYARAEPVRSFLSILSPAPAVFLVLFLFFSPVSDLIFEGEAKAKSVGGVARAPVVVVLLDELPTESLLDDRGRVDSVRYPAFAALARHATWFRNAYAVYDSTERAQPAIMDGNYPEKDKLPTSSDHPNSIFSLFAKTHRLRVSEEATSVCSRDLCKDERLDESYGSRMQSLGEDLGLVWLHVVAPPGLEADLPSVSENWGNFGGDQPTDGGPGDQPETRANLNRNRNHRFEDWIEGIQPGRRPELSFKHSLLPHVPWQYLPSGKQYRRTARDPVPGLSSEAYNDQGQLDFLYQRHLLQLGFTDRLLGKLLRRLQRTGLYDKSLVVVAADHGVAFDLGKRDRRFLTRRNAAQIAAIPLFMKAPGQRRGRVDESLVETVDILPTIFDLLDVRPRVRMDGRSAFSPRVRRRRVVRILERNTFDLIRIPAAQFERERAAALRKKLRLFGSGRDGAARMFRIGPNQQLLGRRVSELPVAPGGGPAVKLVGAQEYRRVDLRSPTVPVHVVGRVTGPGSGGRRDVAIAVNGRIVAVSRTFRLATDDDELVAAMTPESAYRQGRNRVEVYAVGGGRLTRLGGA